VHGRLYDFSQARPAARIRTIRRLLRKSTVCVSVCLAAFDGGQEVARRTPFDLPGQSRRSYWMKDRGFDELRENFAAQLATDNVFPGQPPSGDL
jgi:nitroreductase